MSFTVRKDESSGVVVLGVDGQLIVGNRHELKSKVMDARATVLSLRLESMKMKLV